MRGWISFVDLTMEDKVATLMENESMQYTVPLEVMSYDYHGKMYHVKSNQVDLLVTPNHRMYVGNRNGENFEFKLAEKIYGKRLTYKKNSANYTPPTENRPQELSYIHQTTGEVMETPQAFILTGVSTSHIINRVDKNIPIMDWLIMFGIWMAEGSSSQSYIDFATNKLRVREELNRIGNTHNIKFVKYANHKSDTENTTYRLCSLNYAQYFHPLSVGSTNKTLP
jgi:hypothetical protein